jgi:H+/Cl- antiporter ClcA
MQVMLKTIKQYLIFNESTGKLYGLAIITGLIASIVIILFRLLIDNGHALLSPIGEADSFTQLPWEWIIALPIIGGLAIGIVLNMLPANERQTGIVHVIERLSTHEGRLPIQNTILQFFGAALALITGHSVGREGPSVHLGAASGSLLATQLEQNNNMVRILVASGTAAAISASFNTPIAGVIFAIEVVLMEYHIASFIPVILASVTGVILSRITLDDDTALFSTLSANMKSLWEIPYITMMGILIGGLAVFFIRSLRFFSNLATDNPIWLRTTFAGILVGLGGLALPEVMGLSYGIVHDLTLGEIGLLSLVGLMLLKLVLSTACIGLGIPGGLIGPLLVIGACAGAALGHIAHVFFPDISSEPGFYVMIGMCAMMAAVLKAPLAALMALLELTGNPNIILPGMLAIVFSSVINHEVFKHDPLFILLLKARGLDYKNDPITQTLRRINVASAMQKSVRSIGSKLSHDEAVKALETTPEWILITDGKPLALMPAADLARAISNDEKERIDLLDIPASRRDVHKIGLHASLAEAAKILNEQHVETLYVSRFIAPGIEHVYGILTKEMIEAHYQLPSVRNKS